MRRAAALLLAGLASLSLAGCLEPPECAVPPQVKVLTLPVPAAYLATDPAQPWDALALAWPGEEPATTSYRLDDDAWDVRVDRYLEAPDGAVLERLRVHPGHGAATLTRSWELARQEAASNGACHSGRSGELAWDLKAPEAGEVAEPGMGARVMTAGFWENGTLFYTNIKQLHAAPWPRAGWYSWEGVDPLAVYVYGGNRTERGPTWSATTAGTALGPPTGNATAWHYATTIPGFNAALKGLSTTTARVVRIPPEEAYTWPGNEAHPLYGDALVFYIKLTAVERMPCPDAPLMCRTMPADAAPFPANGGPPWDAATIPLS